MIMKKEYDFSNARKNPYVGKLKKQQITIKIDCSTVEYFKNLEYSCAMKSHFRKSGNQMSGKWKSSYASLLA